MKRKVRVIKNEGTGKEFDEIATIYDDNLKTLLGVLGGENIDKFAEYKVQLVKTIIREAGSIMDFGCGIGRSLAYFRKYFGEKTKLYGCDTSEKSIELAQRILPQGTFFLNTMPKTYIEQEKHYDIVFLACVYHHIDPKDREGWTDAIIDSLSDGGYVAVFEHNLINPFTKRIVRHPENLVDNEKWMLSHKELMRLLTQKYPEVEIFWDGYVLFSPIRFRWSTSFERFLKWLPLGAQHCVIAKKKEKDE